MQPVSRIAVLVLLCLPMAAQMVATQTESKDEAWRRDRQESPLPNAPSSARASQAREVTPADAGAGPQGAEPYQPLSNRQKLQRFVKTTVSPYTFVSGALNATWLQINGEPYAYGGGMNGWVTRFGTT